MAPDPMLDTEDQHAGAEPPVGWDRRWADVYLEYLPADGSVGDRFRLPSKDAVIGCTSSELLASDPYVAPRHMRFYRQKDALYVEDVDSLCGVFLCVDERLLGAGDVLRIGRQLLRFDPAPSGEGGLLAPVAGDGEEGYRVKRETTLIGRSEGDIRFADDRSISNPHARIERRPEGYVVVDLDSDNGVFVRLRAPQRLVSGDFLLIGQRCFRLEIIAKAA